jgi:D-sedoheptulose 7-phosphate isomerase
MSFSKKYISQSIEICKSLDIEIIELIAQALSNLRKREGRLFFIGSGGGAGHSSHAVNDFRKIANIEAYTPTDNVSELTARINDDGWDSSYLNWLKVSRFSSKDALFVFSVGGGNKEKNISVNLVQCVEYANQLGAVTMGVVGKDGGYSGQSSELVLVIPTLDEELITPHTEAFQAVIWHLLVSHPLLLKNQMKWESEQ